MRSMTSLSMLSHVSSHGAPRSLAGPVRLLGVPACFKSPLLCAVGPDAATRAAPLLKGRKAP